MLQVIEAARLFNRLPPVFRLCLSVAVLGLAFKGAGAFIPDPREPHYGYMGRGAVPELSLRVGWIDFETNRGYLDIGETREPEDDTIVYPPESLLGQGLRAHFFTMALLGEEVSMKDPLLATEVLALVQCMVRDNPHRLVLDETGNPPVITLDTIQQRVLSGPGWHLGRCFEDLPQVQRALGNIEQAHEARVAESQDLRLKVDAVGDSLLVAAALGMVGGGVHRLRQRNTYRTQVQKR